MTTEELQKADYIVIEARYLRALIAKVKETRPKNAPPDYDKLRDIENLLALAVGDGFPPE